MNKAASLAALIKELVGVEPEVEAGEYGQFDVLVDGEIVARRGGNWFTRGFGLGYPDFRQVVATILARRRG